MTLTDVISKRDVYGKDFFGEDIFAKTTKLTENSTSPALEITQSGSGKSIKTNDGDVEIVNGDQTIVRYSDTITDRPVLNLAKSKGTPTSPSAVVVDDRFGSVDFEGYDGTSLQRGASITALADGNATSGSIPTRLVLGTSSVGSTVPTSRVVIKENGNVGINESNPQATLHVNGTTTLGTTTIGTTTIGGSGGRFPNGSAAAPSISFTSDTNSGMFRPSGDNLAFVEGGVEAMRITSSGSVGIGTSSVNADAILQLNSTTKGFLPPRMTTTERDAIPAPVPAGLVIYNTTTNVLNFYNGSAWGAV